MNENYRQAEIENCVFVKTVLMILVILYHSAVFWCGNWFTQYEVMLSAEPLAYLAEWLNSFHVFGFSLVSGYLFCFLKYEKNKYDKYGRFVKGKVLRLLIPYVFVSVIWVIPISASLLTLSVNELFKQYVFAISPSQLWFLWMLFDVFVIFYPLSNFFYKHDVLGGFL